MKINLKITKWREDKHLSVNLKIKVETFRAFDLRSMLTLICSMENYLYRKRKKLWLEAGNWYFKTTYRSEINALIKEHIPGREWNVMHKGTTGRHPFPVLIVAAWMIPSTSMEAAVDLLAHLGVDVSTYYKTVECMAISLQGFLTHCFHRGDLRCLWRRSRWL